MVIEAVAMHSTNCSKLATTGPTLSRVSSHVTGARRGKIGLAMSAALCTLLGSFDVGIAACVPLSTT